MPYDTLVPTIVFLSIGLSEFTLLLGGTYSMASRLCSDEHSPSKLVLR